MIMKTVNKAEVAALFEREAVLVGPDDYVPAYRAADLFGEDAVKHVLELTRGVHFNFCGCNSAYKDLICILTFKGFMAAASFCNVRLIGEEVPKTAAIKRQNGKKKVKHKKAGVTEMMTPAFLLLKNVESGSPCYYCEGLIPVSRCKSHNDL